MAPLRATVHEHIDISDEVRVEASEVVEKALDRRPSTLALSLEDGTSIELPAQLSAFMIHTLRTVAEGASMSTHSLPEELTTTTAAAELGISRPTLMKLIREGKLSARKVGSHTRLQRDEVINLWRTRVAEREQNAIDLLRAGEAFD